jgi:hypothetical protein
MGRRSTEKLASRTELAASYWLYEFAPFDSPNRFEPTGYGALRVSL